VPVRGLVPPEGKPGRTVFTGLRRAAVMTVLASKAGRALGEAAVLGGAWQPGVK